MNNIRLGIVGLGHIGKIHLQAINSLQSLKITALCDTNIDVFDNLKNYIPAEDVQCYSDIELMVRQRNFDWIIVATPNTSHFQLANFIIENNIPVILEKPACKTRHQFYHLLHVCKTKNLPIYFALHSAYGLEVEYFLTNKDKILKSFGTPVKFESVFYDFYIKNGKLTPSGISLGNPWIDSGVNALSILSRLGFVDNLELDYADKQTNVNNDEPFSTFKHYYKIKNEPNLQLPLVSGTIETSWNTSSSDKKTIIKFSDNDSLILLHSSQSMLYDKNNEVKQIFVGQRDRLYNHYVNVFSDFIACTMSNDFNYNNTLASNSHFAFFENE